MAGQPGNAGGSLPPNIGGGNVAASSGTNPDANATDPAAGQTIQESLN